MKALISCVICFFALLPFRSFSSDGSLYQVTNAGRAIDGRFDKPCFIMHLDSGGKETSVCRLSFYRLMANPEKYNGKVISVTGFLIGDFKDLIIFPSRNDYSAGNDIDGIVISRPFSISKRIMDKVGAGVSPVVVIGEFDANYQFQRGAIPRLGQMRHTYLIKYHPRVPSGDAIDLRGIDIKK